MKLAAWLWLALCLAAGAHLAARVHAGPIFRTDLLALLPQEERDPDIQRAKDRMIELGARRLVLLLGHPDPARARSAGAAMAEALTRSARFTEVTFAASAEDDRALGRLFHAHRGGLLADADRARLEAGRGREVAQRALAALHLPGAPIDMGFLRDDPFLLLPNFLASLPRPLPRASREDGVLTLREDGVTWLVIGAQLRGDPFTLAVQRPVVDLVEGEARRITAATPGLRMLRAGAVFHADEAAQRALEESTIIGLVSMAAIAVLILGVFREPRALLFGALSLATGTVAAFSVCLAWFGDLHVAALLFGVSLLGVAVDYSLHYQCEALAPNAGPARARIRRVLPGLALGAGATVIGYLTLLASPFPGLHELAIFSVVGIAGALLTVVLWLPAFDRDAPPRHAAACLGAGIALWRFWEEPRWRGARRILVAGLAIVAILGVIRFRIEDDVRRMQQLSPELLAEAAAIERLSGRAPGGPFILVRAADLETALIAEERLLPRLEDARARGVLAGFEATAQFVPSAARQGEARALIVSRLGGPVLDAHLSPLGLALAAVPADTPILTPDALQGSGVLAAIAALSVPGGTGSRLLVPLSGVARPAEVAALAERNPGATFVDPVADTSRLLAEYRRRAVALVALSVALMLPLLALRFGIAGAGRVAFPSVAALAITPLLLAALGLPFTFFSAMALVLVLAMGVDYAIFCREADSGRRPSTMLGIGLAAVTTMLSFGLLAASCVAAVRGFGSSLLVGVGLSLLFAPLAARRS